MEDIGSHKTSSGSSTSSADHLSRQAEQTLPRALRFKDSAQFSHAKRRGVRVHTRHLIAYIVENVNSETRLGVTVSKKVGRAHHRAYIKRLIREAFRRSTLRQSVGFDVSLIAKKDLPAPTLVGLIAELDRLGDQALARIRQPRRSGSHRGGSQRDRSQKRNAKRTHKPKGQRAQAQSTSNQKLNRAHDPETPQSS